MRSLLEEVGLYQKQKLTDRDGDLLKCNAAKSRVLTSKQGKLRRLREGILVLGLRNSARGLRKEYRAKWDDSFANGYSAA